MSMICFLEKGLSGVTYYGLSWVLSIGHDLLKAQEIVGGCHGRNEGGNLSRLQGSSQVLMV